MSSYFDQIPVHDRGAWVVHHGQKTSVAVNGAAEFPALDAAAKAASLLSQLAATDDTTVDSARVEALSKAAGLNPKLELKPLLDMLARNRLIDLSAAGDVAVLGVTSRATVGHASSFFDELGPADNERACIALAELSSAAPKPKQLMQEFISDQFHLPSARAQGLLERSESIGFVDAEGAGADRLYFNGNIFRRDFLTKTKKVLDSLTNADQLKVTALEEKLTKCGCVSVSECQALLGSPLFEKLRAAGMYDINHVANPNGEFGFVTMPAAFHKFNDPMVDDAFDLAKALVAAFTYGITQSSAGRGRIELISVLLRKLIAGQEVGPATAIGEDYRVLETKGVLRIRKVEPYGFKMRLLKKDVGEMALRVLTVGETSAANAVDSLLAGKMTGYSGPEKTRSAFRQKQASESRYLTQDVLQALRTKGAF